MQVQSTRNALLPSESNHSLPITRLRDLERTLRVGDIVFTRIRWTPFRQLADATRTWTNHVGIVVGFNRFGVIVAESRIPFSCRTSFSQFVRRSECGRVAVLRLRQTLTERELLRLHHAVNRRLMKVYDTGFNLNSPRQFCSRFVREVLEEAIEVSIGEVETFQDLLESNPQTDLRLWRLWYFGAIPWERTTVTPASMYGSPLLDIVFDGEICRCRRPHLRQGVIGFSP